MVKDPNCKNKIWNKAKLEELVEARVLEVLRSPQLVEEIASKKDKPKPTNKNAGLETRIREIDKQISKLMELYQMDGIPPEILGDKINRLYNERTTLQESIASDVSAAAVPFDLAEAIISDAANVWDFADEDQKRRILQSLINRIVINGSDVDIEWSF